MLNYLNNFKVYENKFQTIKIKAKWNKNKRINKKIMKKKGQRFVYVPSDTMFVTNDKCIFIHPTTLKRLKKQLEKENNK